MDCQSGSLLKALVSFIFPGANLDSECPAQGQCLNVGMDGRTDATKILTSAKNAVIAVWHTECCLGHNICIESFRTSVPLKQLLKKVGFTPERVVAAANNQIALHHKRS
jgi:hypothetical protein